MGGRIGKPWGTRHGKCIVISEWRWAVLILMQDLLLRIASFVRLMRCSLVRAMFRYRPCGLVPNGVSVLACAKGVCVASMRSSSCGESDGSGFVARDGPAVGVKRALFGARRED